MKHRFIFVLGILSACGAEVPKANSRPDSIQAVQADEVLSADSLCESWNFAQQICNFSLGHITEVSLKTQISVVLCGGPGENWGYDTLTNTITVINGCRAVFEVKYIVQ